MKTVAHIEGRGGGPAAFFAVCFYIWRILGFIVITIELIETNSRSPVGVGQSAYIAMHMTYYMAVCVFLGLGALIPKRSYEFQRDEPQQ